MPLCVRSPTTSRTRTTRTASTGYLLSGGLVVVGGLPAVLLAWLWTAEIRVLLIGAAIVVVWVLLSAMLTATATLRGD
jgi:hypothetical protein